MPVRALLWDFDGLMVDTESLSYEVISDIFTEAGYHLTHEAWSAAIGTQEAFDAWDHLESLSGAPVDRPALNHVARERWHDAFPALALQPGVIAHLERAGEIGLRQAIASSSSADLDALMRTRGLREHFEVIRSWDRIGRPKPAPDVYLAVLAAMDLDAREVVAYEDSPNGVTAAKAAGIFTIAVPNPMTARLDLGHADLTISSLDAVTLDEVLAAVG